MHAKQDYILKTQN